MFISIRQRIYNLIDSGTYYFLSRSRRFGKSLLYMINGIGKPNNLIFYEGYYASVIFSFLFSLGYDIIAEDVTNRGRIDLTLKTKDSIFILEYKVDTNEEAIKQIKERKYYEKYLNENKVIFMVGINFDSELKNISNYWWEKVT